MLRRFCEKKMFFFLSRINFVVESLQLTKIEVKNVLKIQ